MTHNLVRIDFEFKTTVLWILVFAQADKDWLAQTVVRRPFGKLYLGHQRGLDPLHRLVGFGWFDKGAFIYSQRLHQFVDRGEQLLIESPAYMRDIMQFVSPVETAHQ